MWLVSSPQCRVSFSTKEETPTQPSPRASQPGDSGELLVFIPNGKDVGTSNNQGA